MFTIEQLRNEVIRIGTERPDVMYRSDAERGACYDAGVCSDGTVGCLFGQAIRKLDPGFKFKFKSGMTGIRTLLNENLGLPEYDLKVNELAEVQRKQDSGLPWGKCVEILTKSQ